MSLLGEPGSGSQSSGRLSLESDSRGAPVIFGVARVLAAGWLTLTVVFLSPVSAGAEVPPFRTVIGPVVPTIAGLSVTGAPGGCDLFLLNQTGQDVLLIDDGSPAQSRKFASAPKAGPKPPPTLVHLAGNWKCSTIRMTGELAWNNLPVTVASWTLHGQVGAQAFRAPAQTVYDPTLDSGSGLISYVRIGAIVAALGGLLIGLPYLLMRRRQILSE